MQENLARRDQAVLSPIKCNSVMCLPYPDSSLAGSQERSFMDFQRPELGAFSPHTLPSLDGFAALVDDGASLLVPLIGFHYGNSKLVQSISSLISHFQSCKILHWSLEQIVITVSVSPKKIYKTMNRVEPHQVQSSQIGWAFRFSG